MIIGEVEIVLDGETRTLRPTLNAFSGLGAKYDIQPLLRALAASNVAAILDVLRFGLDLSDAEARELPGKLLRTGVVSVVAPLSLFVFKLFTGGKSPAEFGDDAEVKGEDTRPL